MMDYRSPLLSLQNELEVLEEELAAVRALPPAAPRPAPKHTKKSRDRIRRENADLRRQLKRIQANIAAHPATVQNAATRSSDDPVEKVRVVQRSVVALGSVVLCAELIVCSSGPLSETLSALHWIIPFLSGLVAFGLYLGLRASK